jgi:hypothetical protein
MNRSRGVVVFDNGKSLAATRLSRSFWRGANRTRTQGAAGTRAPTRNGAPMPTPFSTVDDSTQFATEWIWPFHRRVWMLRCSMARSGGCCARPERSRLRKSRNRTVISRSVRRRADSQNKAVHLSGRTTVSRTLATTRPLGDGGRYPTELMQYGR